MREGRERKRGREREGEREGGRRGSQYNVGFPNCIDKGRSHSECICSRDIPFHAGFRQINERRSSMYPSLLHF